MDTRIVYVGAERVGLSCLQRLVEMGKHIVGVFTAHDELRPVIADFVSFDESVRPLDIPFFKVKRSRSLEFIDQIEALRPDLILVISWSQIIPKEVLDCAPLGCVGIHYSLLPARRGGAPLNWALIDGLTKSGITLFYYDDGIDTGDIIGQREFEISFHDTVKTLLDKIVALAPELLAEYLSLIEKGRAPRIKQREEAATYTKRRKPKDSEIQWDKLSDEALYNFIRALAPPFPSAFTCVGNRRLVVTAAQFIEGKLRIEGHVEPRVEIPGREKGGL